MRLQKITVLPSQGVAFQTSERDYPGFWIGYLSFAEYNNAKAPFFGLPEDLRDFNPKKIGDYIND